MSWDDLPETEIKLTSALERFSWTGVRELCARLVKKISAEETPLPERDARRLLGKLRRKRQFQHMTSVAEALIQSGQRTPQIRRLYSQALIDQGILTASEFVLQSIIQEAQSSVEVVEAHGLIGRIYKQLYVNSRLSGGVGRRMHLECALKEYFSAYELARDQNLWHGINAVALLDRARRDRVVLQGSTDPSVIAHEIIETLNIRQQQATDADALPYWDLATGVEAHIALGQLKEAEKKTLEYVNHPNVDAFEIGSTLRQLTEVWQLTDREQPGSSILPTLRAALLRHEAGTVDLTTDKICEEMRVVDTARHDLERTFGSDRTQSLRWYRTGLERCQSIARVERRDGKAFGTGWLVDGGEFFNDQERRLLLLTNAHVLSENEPKALRPNDATINFQVLGQRYDVESIVWSSPVADYDATFVSLKGDTSRLSAVPISPDPIQIDDPPPRMYVIGHPGGRELEFSLQDNYFLGCKGRLVHYRSPTEPGSSGSPVFEPLAWRAVALHHAGKYQMDRIDGILGKYEANEGIAICAIREATRAQKT
jgi:hypothetical protein